MKNPKNTQQKNNRTKKNSETSLKCLYKTSRPKTSNEHFQYFPLEKNNHAALPNA